VNIHIIYTGGTIGSERGADGAIGISDHPPASLISYPGVNFTHSSPYRILSETITPAHWDKLLGHIHSITENPDAILITHGTDTLAYTAAFLALACRGVQGVNVPVFMISSDRPLSDPGANGIAHMEAAVAAARAGAAPGVYIPYRNPGTGETVMHRGERIMQAGDFSDAFYSIPGHGYGNGNGNGHGNGNGSGVLQPDTGARTRQQTCPLVLSAKILQIRPYPGIDYSAYDLSGVCAVLHGTYHSHTADADAVIAFAKKAADTGKKVYFAPISSVPEKRYATSEKLIGSGLVIPLYDMTFESAYALLLMTESQQVGSNREQRQQTCPPVLW
jgi:L-asparaginase